MPPCPSSLELLFTAALFLAHTTQELSCLALLCYSKLVRLISSRVADVDPCLCCLPYNLGEKGERVQAGALPVLLYKYTNAQIQIQYLPHGGRGARFHADALSAFAAFPFQPSFRSRRFCIQSFYAVNLSLSRFCYIAKYFYEADCDVRCRAVSGKIWEFDKTPWCGYFDQRVAPINSISNHTKSLLAGRDKSYRGYRARCKLS